VSLRVRARAPRQQMDVVCKKTMTQPRMETTEIFFLFFDGKIGRNFFVQSLSAKSNGSQWQMQRIGTQKNLVKIELKTQLGQFGVRS